MADEQKKRAISIDEFGESDAVKEWENTLGTAEFRVSEDVVPDDGGEYTIEVRITRDDGTIVRDYFDADVLLDKVLKCREFIQKQAYPFWVKEGKAHRMMDGRMYKVVEITKNFWTDKVYAITEVYAPDMYKECVKIVEVSKVTDRKAFSRKLDNSKEYAPNDPKFYQDGIYGMGTLWKLGVKE